MNNTMGKISAITSRAAGLFMGNRPIDVLERSNNTNGTFSSRVLLINNDKGNPDEEFLKVEIRGSFKSPEGTAHAVIKVYVTDTTERNSKIKPVYANDKKWQDSDSDQFCAKEKLGTIQNTTEIPDWMTVMTIPADCLHLPRKGMRNLKFEIIIQSLETSEEIAFTSTNIIYENRFSGYLDEQEKIDHANILAVPLAYTFALSGNKITPEQQDIINEWITKNTSSSQISWLSRKSQILYGKILSHFKFIANNKSRKLCQDITKTAPAPVKYNILGLCMQVIEASEKAQKEQIDLLKNTAVMLEIQIDKLRSMIEDMHPFYMYQVDDMEILLGISNEMSKEQVNEKLNNEYRKWNSRVINSDPEIRAEAKHMLEKIGELKTSL